MTEETKFYLYTLKSKSMLQFIKIQNNKLCELNKLFWLKEVDVNFNNKESKTLKIPLKQTLCKSKN